jgi:alkylation response protein AidB-like acyl-CoA dehydrogenase
MHLDGYGCAGRNGVSYGLACLELEAGDSGLRSFVSVQGSLAMYPIWRFGSEDAKQRWLPAMVAGEAVGCFALTEPTAGSNPAQMRTFARRDGSDWVLDGHKRWSTNASIADVAVVWAQTDDGVRGFVVPTDTRGVSAPPITNKGMLLALHLGRMKDAKRLRHEQVSHGKLNNVREALTIARTARTVLGAEGITTNQPVMRHMANLESVLTYEGTSEVHILALGKALTGLSAFT